ncbi:hypothetical protein A176_006958 [Myxococcus hansupus]|uniref:Uncharacterized protein n=1 Tax=Pseudomyxococcus hansupus TaxID=1297742 RepID=A0A0H4X334_9BACT|nr:hypothetical protein A176_006958 [Myxococcus hansupus]
MRSRGRSPRLRPAVCEPSNPGLTPWLGTSRRQPHVEAGWSGRRGGSTCAERGNGERGSGRVAWCCGLRAAIRSPTRRRTAASPRPHVSP